MFSNSSLFEDIFNSLESTLLPDDSSAWCEEDLLRPGALEPIPFAEYTSSHADATGGSAINGLLELTTDPEDVPDYLEPSHPSAPWQQVGRVNMNSDDFQPNTDFPTIKPDFFSSFGGTLQTNPKDKNSVSEMLVSKATNKNEVGSPPVCITTHQSARWNDRLHELRHFRQEYGHCCVPSHWPQNPTLSQWVKKQRHQYRIKNEGQHTPMTEESERLLEELGFIWDSHSALWEERLNNLHAFREKHGHCKVSTKYPENPQLAIWAKCQRRQFKLFCTEGPARSNVTLERISKLARVGFIFNPRAKAKRKMTHTAA